MMIEVDEERLDDVVSQASSKCCVLYSLAFHEYCDIDTDCNKCPFNDSESIVKWLRKED